MFNKQRVVSFWQQWKTTLVFLTLIILFRSAIADWNLVPTRSMEPTILVGDRIWVNKLAYDIRVPYSGMPLVQLKNPERGDIIIFPSPMDGTRLVKRIVGLPLERVKMIANVLYIDDNPLTYQLPNEATGASVQQQTLLELLPGSHHPIKINRSHPSFYSHFSEVKIPTDHYLVLGDNRDNSGDSRVFGFIHRDLIIGQATNVFWSLDHDSHYLPRTERFWHPLP